MSEFNGRLRMASEEREAGLDVTVDLTDGTLGLRAETGELGRWLRDHVIISAQEDGFHLRADGEEVILTLEQDAEFAVEAGLTSGPPMLRRRMSDILRQRH